MPNGRNAALSRWRGQKPEPEPASPSTLGSLGAASDSIRSWAASAAAARSEEILSARDEAPAAIVIIANTDSATAAHAANAAEIGAVFAKRFAAASVTVLNLARDLDDSEAATGLPDEAPGNLSVRTLRSSADIHDAMRVIPELDLIVELLDRHATRVPAIDPLFLYLRDGGLYSAQYLREPENHDPAVSNNAVEDGFAPTTLLDSLTQTFSQPLLGRLATGTSSAPDHALIGAMANLELSADAVFISKQGSLLLKTSEDDFDERFVMERRLGWAAVETIEDSRVVVSRSTTQFNRPDFESRFRREVRLPALRIRRYDMVDCDPRQLVHRDGVLLPDTFRLYRQARIKNSALHDYSAHFAALRGSAQPRTDLPGVYFHLDSEWTTIYGHLVTEVISRLWAWDKIKLEHPGIRVLISTAPDADDIPAWFRTTLESYGISADEICVFNGPVRVETLLCATPLFSNPEVAHPRLREVWSRISAGLSQHSSLESTPERVFVARTAGLDRSCHNHREIEELFMSHGYELFYPEQHSLADQAAVFHGATAIAGYGGSGMLNSVYGRPGQHRIVIAPEGYTAMNEYLIASVFGDPIAYFWGRPDVPYTPGSWSEKAFHSDYTLDLEAEGRELPALLRQLDQAAG